MPSAICQLNELLEFFDFVSIGTNDLVQYFFAVDRGNKKVSRYFCPMHPLILRVLKKIIDTCDRKTSLFLYVAKLRAIHLLHQF